MSTPGASPRRPGLFITVEGIEGVGKSTQVEGLARRLRDAGSEVVVTREPGGTALGRRLRAILLEREGVAIDPVTELLLYAADRAQHIVERIRPALERGAVVICDRYLDATLAYQGHARGLGVRPVLELHARPPLDLRPHRTLVLDLDPGVALARARGRNRASRTESAEGRFEDESVEFHTAVRRGYLELAAADPARYRVVPADGDPGEVLRRVVEAVADLVPAVVER